MVLPQPCDQMRAGAIGEAEARSGLSPDASPIGRGVMCCCGMTFPFGRLLIIQVSVLYADELARGVEVRRL